MQQHIDQMDKQTQMVTSCREQIESLLEEIRGCCENVEKSREKLQQCIGIPEPGALWLRQRNTEQWKETSAQVEKAQQQDRMKVSQEQDSSSRALEQLRRQSSGQGHALAQVCREKELLGQEKAALEGRLAAMGQQQQELCKQLAETRSAKDILESSLSAAQLQISQLEMSRTHLEAQVLTVTQAKAVVEGENLVCFKNEQERHRAELQEMLKQWQEEKAKREQEHEKVLLEMRQKVATLQAQQQEQQIRFEKAKRQVQQKEQNEKRALTETLLQTRGDLSQACQQVEELTFQLAASREFQESTVQRAQQDVSEAQEESRQKQLEAEHIQKQLGEKEHQKKKLQVYLQNVEREWSHWEEVARKNSEYHAFVSALKRERTRLIRSLEEKNVCLRSLEEKNVALNNQLSQFHSALQQAEQLSSIRARKMQKLNSQAEVSELRLRLQSSEERAEAMATHCEAMEMELKIAHADYNQIKACNQELQTLLEETQQATWRAEHEKIFLRTGLKDVATTLKEEAVTVHQEMEYPQRKLESQEKERKDLLHERELYEQQLRDLEKKKEMGAPDIQRWKKITQELEMEREDMQEELDHGTAAALMKSRRGELKGRENVQVLRSALRKSEVAKGTLKKNFIILQRKSPDNSIGQSHLQVLQEGQNEKRALTETLLQTRGDLSQACQQVEELTAQLAASREFLESTVQRAQQDVSEAQEESRQKMLETEHIQKRLEEAEDQKKELQMQLQNLERERNQWDEVAQQNSELQASMNVLGREKARLILSLEEKNVCLRSLEEKNVALNNQLSQFNSALQQAEQLSSIRARKMQELNSQIQALQDAVLEMEAAKATREKELLQELGKSRAGEQSLRDAVHVLQAEVSELRLRLQSSDDKALTSAIQCESVKLELRKTQTQRNNLSTRNLELQKDLEEIERDLCRAENKHISRESALKKESFTFRQGVASLQRKLESQEKERKDVLHERELYEQQLRDLEKKKEMGAPDIQRWKKITQELEMEREDMQEELDHGTAAALMKRRRGELKGRENVQVLRSALRKSEVAKGTLKKNFIILQRKSPDNSIGQSHLQVQQKEQNEKRALTEALLQTRGDLSQACQQTIKAKLQAELQEAHNEIQTAQKRHKEELQCMKEEMNVLFEQRDALQEQVEELTAQLAASREFLESTVQRAQQDVSEAQEESRQKMLEAEDIQKRLEEAEDQKKELQMQLQNLERERNQWDEVAQQNSELQASMNVLGREKARLILSLEEKNVCLRSLEEKNVALNNQLSQFNSALQQAEQLSSIRARKMQKLNSQIQALQDAVLEMEAAKATREKELLQELGKSQAGEQSLRDAVHVLQAEVSELRLRLQRSDDKALTSAIQCESVKLELRKTQTQRNNLSTRNLGLQKDLEEIERDLCRAENKHISRESALKKESFTFRQGVASLQRKLESQEKERKDVLVSLLQSQLARDRQHRQNYIESCSRTSQELELEDFLTRDNPPEPLSCCKNLEKSREKLLQCIGIPEPGALWLHQRNTEKQKETSAQVEKAQQQDRMKVSQEQDSSSRALEQLRRQSSGQGHALAQVCREKELLGQKKAALEGRLAAMGQQQQELCKQLAETRAAKESLESSLSAAQLQISQLEMSRTHLEAQVLTVTQAKAVVEGEDLVCFKNEQERHHAELQEMLEQWQEEKAKREQEHEEVLLEMRQKVATLQAQQQEQQIRFEKAKRQVQQKEQNEKRALTETLLQTRGDLSQACQQVEELTSQLAASREFQESTVQRAQKDVNEAQEETRQKQLEADHIQKQLGEKEHQKKKLQVYLQNVEREWSHWEEVAHKNSEYHAFVSALKRERTRLILSLEKKNVCLRSLEEKNVALNNQLSQFNSALQQAEHLSSIRARKMQKLNTQIQALQDAVLEMEAAKATREKELLQELEKSRAGEQSLRDAVHVLEAEVSELRLRLQSSEQRAETMATHCEAMEMELRMAQADNNQIKACNQELQTLLEETQQATWRAEHEKIFLRTGLKDEATALKKEAVTVHQEMEYPQRKLESQEKERKDVLHERELYKQQLRDLEKKKEMGAPDIQRWKKISQELEVEREDMQEELDHGTAAAALNKSRRGELKGRENVQVLRSALRKSEVAKGTLKKKLVIQQIKSPDNSIGQSHLQVQQKEQDEKRALTETLLQTRGDLSQACQQTIKAKLQAELQEAQNEIQTAQERHKEELQCMKEEMNVLLEQRDALQKQVEELTAQLAASQEFLESTVQRAQQDVSEAQEESRQKMLEAEDIQKRLEEAEDQKKELQMQMQNLERERNQWEEVAQQNSELQASMNALGREKARLILSLEEKNVCLRSLEEKNVALNNQLSQFNSALQQAEHLSSIRARKMQKLNTQIQALQDAVLEMEAAKATREKELLQELGKSRAGEQSLRDAVHVLQAEVSELRLRLQRSDDKALTSAIQCESVKLELRKTQTQRNNLSTRNLELQWDLEEIERDLCRAENKHISRESALKKESFTFRQGVASLQRKLESQEKERKDLLVSLLQSQLARDRQHRQNYIESCSRTSQELELEDFLTRDNPPEPLSCCKNLEKSREKLLQCIGIPEPGALWLHQRNTEKQKETSAQVEKAQQQDRMKVSQEQDSSSRALEQLRRQSSGQGHALAQVCREKELLGQKKAALEGRLAAMGQQQQELCKQLAETRAAKESLESSLSAAQLQISQLEMSRTHLEAQVLTVTQAKAVVEGEDLVCFKNEQERHHAELQEMLEQWQEEKAKREQEHEEVLLEMRQKVATLQAQQQEQQIRFEKAKRQVQQKEQNEKRALTETLLQTRGDLSQACQQVEELTSQLAASREFQESTVQRAQKDVNEAQEETRQKQLEADHIQKQLGEKEHQKKKLQVYLQNVEREWSHWEEVAHKNSEYHAFVSALKRERTRLILSLEKKNVCLRSLEEKNVALNNQLSQFNSALQQAEHLSSIRARKMQKLNTQIQALQDAVLEMEAAKATREKELLQELEKSRAGEQSLRDAVHVLQVEVSELRLRLQSSEERAEAMAIHCEAMEMELRMAQADNNQIKACNQELQTLLEETQQATWRAEHEKIFLRTGLKDEATALKKEAVTVHQEMEYPQRKLESQEKERKDVLHERELYEQQLRDLEKKKEMGAPDIQRWKKISQELEVEREDMQEELDHGTAAAALNKSRRGELKGRENVQVLRSALRKSEVAKGTLKKKLVIQQIKSPDNSIGQSHLQVQQKEQDEKRALTETLLQTRGDLSQACQQTIKAKLQAELQEAQNEIQTAQERHKEELQCMKEEMNVLLEQRDALQKQVEELTAQLAASQEFLESTVQRAQQDVSEAQEESRQKMLEAEDIQKRLEEAEDQKKELQMQMQNLERERNQWEEVAQQNSELQASMNVLGREKARLILSLEEKNVCLRSLEEKNVALNNQLSQFNSALQQAEHLSSIRARKMQKLNTQIQALQDAVLEMEAAKATREKELLQELGKSRAGEQSLRDAVHVLQAEVSELRLRLQRSDDKALTSAIQCESVKLELRKTQTQRNNLSTRNLELQWDLEEIERDLCRAENKHISRESALKKESFTFRQGVASLQRKLESQEKERKDLLSHRQNRFSSQREETSSSSGEQ
ncbi:centrosome-associated protein CEP250-like [Poecile atricapillus]|uniref:centrosome-associated protein CEP250-like n=1 Tax=Poecile atricapillus TaxID=48891 RepID=UPI002739C36E|nr:centrosome-associated protein CEP250-like [Poecile atricapillus]